MCGIIFVMIYLCTVCGIRFSVMSYQAMLAAHDDGKTICSESYAFMFEIDNRETISDA